MEVSVPGEHNNPGPSRPEWSVIAGEFDPGKIIIDGVLVGRMADKFWYSTPGSDGRRALQARELVLRSFELSGLDRGAIEEKVTAITVKLKNYAEQVELVKRTPELDVVNSEEGEALFGPSPVMNTLRLLIDGSNRLESILLHDNVIDDKEKWEVDDDTRLFAEAVIRELYLQEQPLISVEPVE